MKTNRGQTLPFDLGSNSPIAEVRTAAAGVGNAASRWDHAHPRLTSATVGTLDASNEAVITFTRSFSLVPCMDFTYIEATDNPPLVFKVKSWTQDGSNNYIGCVTKAYRGQILPSLSGIIIIGPLISALSQFNIFGGSASGIPFTCIALQQS